MKKKGPHDTDDLFAERGPLQVVENPSDEDAPSVEDGRRSEGKKHDEADGGSYESEKGSIDWYARKQIEYTEAGRLSAMEFCRKHGIRWPEVPPKSVQGR